MHAARSALWRRSNPRFNVIDTLGLCHRVSPLNPVFPLRCYLARCPGMGAAQCLVMNAKLIAAFVAVAASARAEDLGFRLDAATCECRNAAGVRGYNPGFVGECGLLGEDPAGDPDVRGAGYGAELDGVDFSGKNLRGVQLRGAFLRRAKFSKADLTCADLQHARLRYADFTGATLRFSTFRMAYLTDARFDGADLRGAYLDGFLKGMRLESCSLAGALIDSTSRIAGRFTVTPVAVIAER